MDVTAHSLLILQESDPQPLHGGFVPGPRRHVIGDTGARIRAIDSLGGEIDDTVLDREGYVAGGKTPLPDRLTAVVRLAGKRQVGQRRGVDIKRGATHCGPPVRRRPIDGFGGR